MKSLFFPLLFCTLLAQGQSPVKNGQTPVLLTDMLRIRQPGGLQLSPDGTKAYFTLTSIEAEADKTWEYQYRTQIWTVSTDGQSAPRQLTSSKEGASQLAVSPDGQQIVFVRNTDGKPQLYLLPLAGGEAIQLTRSRYGAASPKWSPDGRQLAFVSSIPLTELANDTALNPDKQVPEWSIEKPGFGSNAFILKNNQKADPDGSLDEVRAWLSKNEQDKKAKVITRLQFQGESATNGELARSHVFIISAQGGAIARQVTKGFQSYSNPQFLSAGQLLVEGEMTDNTHPDRNLSSALYRVNTDGSGFKLLLGKKDYRYFGATVSPSGKWIALQHSATGFVTVPALAIMPAGGSEKDLTDIPFDRNKGGLTWKGDDMLYAITQSNGGAILLQYDLKTKKQQVLGSTDEGISSIDIAANRLVYVKTMVSNPFEVYTADLYAKNEKTLTGFNREWLAAKSLSLPTKHSFINEKGMTIEYWVMKPANYTPGKKFPLLLQIHGGPSAMWGPGESSMWHEFQYWSSKGYGVVYSNPRGSGGYGYDFLRANVNDWGKGPMQDVLTALDKTVAEGWGDTSRLFVTGGSYAGYLVGYILGHDKRFRAACSQRGVYDLRTFFGEGNAWRLVPNYFGGYPWESRVLETLERESPINYVENITTPYIIFHGENDLRTGVIQSEQIYKSLKVLGRPVEYVRHPGATHEITRSGNNRQRMDQMLRTWEFFERFR
ncbi:S9 family peptidase [Flavihumibacter stibioxidans]|uniref:Peptidase S9 n=1 Tax=Flavihumibacter stibioxidans TaxID=1834163 RepID=A0ABR7MBK7_9BACT|nr:S9 family peptidase [Flavihumibacter stibioxidans]MBC6491948.1 peptidase S9 [Flavihumibacter stibioxidans]